MRRYVFSTLFREYHASIGVVQGNSIFSMMGK